MCNVQVEDKFVAMMNAHADVDLRLSDFHPVSELRTVEHVVEKPRFPVIDYHNHLDSQDPAEMLRIMDECGVEKIVNITMLTGDAAIESIRKYHTADKDRFATIGWMDWTGVERDDFVAVTLDRLERLIEHGACGIKFWKDFGLTVKDREGKLLRIDDERFAPIFEKAADWKLPVMFHTADPAAFFRPIDAANERYEELAAHPEWGFQGSPVGKRELLEQRNVVFGRHPRTAFVGAHVGESCEDLAFVSRMLDSYPNVCVDMSSRTPELGRQPYTAREFFLRYPDRIVFGTDLVPTIEMYRLHYRFFETADEYFEYPSHASRQGRWNIYGIFLPDEILRKVYRENALKLLER